MEAPVKKEDSGGTQHPEYALLDTSNLSQKLLFTRLPDFLYEELQKKKTRTPVGKLVIRTPAGATEPIVSIVFSPEVVQDLPFEELPTEFEVRINKECQPNQYVFTHQKDSGYVRMLGQVSGEAQLTSSDSAVMRRCRLAAEKIRKPRKASKAATMLSTPPSAEPESPFRYGGRPRQPKVIKDKRIKKSDRDMRLGIIRAFQETPEWRIKDLAERLDQGADHVKNHVGEFADYDQNTQMWRLRPGTLVPDDD
jgi:hypothetical protein